MGASTTGANLVLDATTDRDMWLGIALSADRSLSSVVEADGAYLATPRVLVPAAGWAAAAAREVVALAATDHGAALVDFTPQFWVLWSSPSGGAPLFSRRVTDTTARAGDRVTVPAATIRLLYTN